MVEKQVVEKLVEQVMEQFSDAIAFYSEMKRIGGKEDYAGLSGQICSDGSIYARRRMSPGSTQSWSRSSSTSRPTGRQESSTLLSRWLMFLYALVHAQINIHLHHGS